MKGRTQVTLSDEKAGGDGRTYVVIVQQQQQKQSHFRHLWLCSPHIVVVVVVTLFIGHVSYIQLYIVVVVVVVVHLCKPSPCTTPQLLRRFIKALSREPRGERSE